MDFWIYDRLLDGDGGLGYFDQQSERYARENWAATFRFEGWYDIKSRIKKVQFV
jgi:hypothetical protein